MNGAITAAARVVDRLDTSQLGRICIDPNDDKIRADMVREAIRRTGSAVLHEAAEIANDAAQRADYLGNEPVSYGRQVPRRPGCP